MTHATDSRDTSLRAQLSRNAEPFPTPSQTSAHNAPQAPIPGSSRLIGIATLIASMGFLTLAITGSVIAWERWGESQPIVATQTAAPDLSGIHRQLTDLREENRLMRAELDTLSGPGGVLPRVIEQLQTFKERNRAQAVAIDQLVRLQVQEQDPIAAIDPNQPNPAAGLGPIQVTPVRSSTPERPVRVVVTPEPSATTASEGQGQ